MPEQAIKVDNYSTLDDSKVCYWWNSILDCWFIYLPDCGVGRLTLHTVVENVDGTITVTPSILMKGHKDGAPTQRHGYLTNGVWTEV